MGAEQRCILSKFYIKPQRITPDYLNYRGLYLIEILHQTTTIVPTVSADPCCILSKFYIKPQQYEKWAHLDNRCILSKFYIKPQRSSPRFQLIPVVSYRNSTSNHNNTKSGHILITVVSYRNSTSNHNPLGFKKNYKTVVSYRNSTSNHNFHLTRIYPF